MLRCDRAPTIATSTSGCASTQAIASWLTSQPLCAANFLSSSTTRRLVRRFSPVNADACERQSSASKVVSSVIVPVSRPEPSGL